MQAPAKQCNNVVEEESTLSWITDLSSSSQFSQSAPDSFLESIYTRGEELESKLQFSAASSAFDKNDEQNLEAVSRLSVATVPLSADESERDAHSSGDIMPDVDFAASVADLISSQNELTEKFAQMVFGLCRIFDQKKETRTLHPRASLGSNLPEQRRRHSQLKTCESVIASMIKKQAAYSETVQSLMLSMNQQLQLQEREGLALQRKVRQLEAQLGRPNMSPTNGMVGRPPRPPVSEVIFNSASEESAKTSLVVDINRLSEAEEDVVLPCDGRLQLLL